MNKIFALVILLSITMVGCKKEGKISDDIQPEKDKLKVYKVDTISYNVTTFSPDSIQSNGLTNFIFGGYRDDVFGMTKGHFVTQLRFNEISYIDTVAMRDSIVIDSLFFILPYIDYIGDSLLANEITIYELQTPVDNLEPYYSNFDLSTAYDKSKPLGSLYYRVKEDNNIIDSYVTNGQPIYGLKVPLNNELGKRLVDNVDLYANDLSAFQDFFKGIVAVSTFGSKAMLQVNPLLYDTYEYKCRMLLHYHDARENYPDSAIANIDTTVTPADTIWRKFTAEVERQQSYYVNNECGRFSVLEQDFDGSEIKTAAVLVNDEDYPYAFIRGGGSLRMRIKMPDFKKHPSFQALPNQDSARIAINRAKLTMKVDIDAINVNKITPPASIIAYVDDGKEISRIDDLTYGSDYFGGGLSYSTFTYEINIAEFVQNSLYRAEDEPQKDIIIAVSNDAFSPFFTLIGKPNHPDPEKQMKFEVVYTRY